jgi:hypothetical protein
MTRLRVNRLTQRIALVLSCALASAAVTAPAYAAPDKEELSRARARFQQATELEQAGNWAAALQQFREVGQVRMTPQVRYHIALCEEKLGKLVAALGGYELALAEAESLGPDFHKEVEDKTNALRERIPKLVIERGEGAEAATIELDGIALGASSIGIEVPLDPGPHQIAARASGYDVYTETIEVPEKETKRVTVSLAKIAANTTANPNEGNAPAAPAAPPPHPARIVPYAVGIGGGVLLVTSGVFFLMRQSEINTLNGLCGSGANCVIQPGSGTTPDQVNHEKSKLGTYNAAMIVTGLGGLAAVGVAVGLLVLEPKAPKPQAATSLHINPIAPGANIGGVSLAGAF